MSDRECGWVEGALCEKRVGWDWKQRSELPVPETDPDVWREQMPKLWEEARAEEPRRREEGKKGASAQSRCRGLERLVRPLPSCLAATSATAIGPAAAGGREGACRSGKGPQESTHPAAREYRVQHLEHLRHSGARERARFDALWQPAAAASPPLLRGAVLSPLRPSAQLLCASECPARKSRRQRTIWQGDAGELLLPSAAKAGDNCGDLWEGGLGHLQPLMNPEKVSPHIKSWLLGRKSMHRVKYAEDAVDTTY
ncbi:hypothetical protein BDZ91DRAFT_762557 [Kalaharituber pfeilii]|nr:hypothetical protein BDZ91DRAFT_762557 [Kalaharituber pfeilii]